MATTTTLGFSILSRYSGHGVTQARRDLMALRAQMATINGDLQRHTTVLNGIPQRWKAIGAAAALIAPALVPITAAAGAATGAFLAMTAAVGSALTVYGVAMKGAIDRTMQMASAGKALSPVQKEYVAAVGAMSKAWKQFIADNTNKTLGPAVSVVRGLTSGIKLLQPLLDAIHPSAVKAGKAFEAWMKGDSAKNYSNIIAGIARTSMPMLLQAARNTLNFLGDGFRAFAPLANNVARAILRGSQALKSWSDGGGFQRFLQYVRENGPAVNAFWAAFRAALSNVLAILKEFAGGSLRLLTDSLRALSVIDPGALKAFANAFILLKSPMLWLVLNCPPLRDLIIKLLGAMNPAIVYAIVGAFVALRVAFLLMNTALLTTPLGWVIIGLTALGVAVAVIATKTTWFQTAWQYTWNFIKTVGLAIWNALKVAFTAFINFFVTIWQTVGPGLTAAWNAVWTVISGLAKGIWLSLQQIWQAFVTAIGSIWSIVGPALQAAWSVVWTVISTVAMGIWTALQIAWQTFINAIILIWNVIGPVLQAAWSVIWTVISTVAMGIWTALQMAWSLFVSGIQLAWSIVAAVFTAAWNVVWTAISTVAQAIWTTLQALWNAFVNGGILGVWNLVAGALQAAWNAVWTGIRTAAQAVWTAMQAAWSAFTTSLATAWTAVSSALVAAWNAVWTGIRTAAQAVWTAMQAAWSAFITALSATWSAVSGALSAAWSAFWNAIRTVASAIWTGMQAAWSAFWNAMTAAWNAFRSALTSAWSAFWGAVRTTATTIWNAIKAAWSAFIAAITAAWNAFRTFFQNAWWAAWGFVRDKATEIWNAIKAGWSAFISAITSAWNAFRTFIQDAWWAAWGFVRDKAKEIWDAIKGLWNGFLEGIKEIWTTASGWIKDKWNETWNWLSDRAKSIWNTIGGIIEKAINGILKLINGLTAGFNKVTKFLHIPVTIGEIDPVNFPKLANGGMVEFAYGGMTGGPKDMRGGGALGGYAPGKDTIPAILSKGEGVLTPEAVRGLGGPAFVNGANKQWAGHRGAGRGAVPLHRFNGTHEGDITPFANGGMVGGRVPFAVGGMTADALRRAGVSLGMVSQGEYSNGSLSAGTHAGGGVVDISSTSGAVVAALRAAGFAAWARTGPAWAGNEHIHAVLMNHPALSGPARAQVASFKAGGNGLGVGGGGGSGGGPPSWLEPLLSKAGEILSRVAQGLGIDGIIGSIFGGGGGDDKEKENGKGLFGTGIGPDVGPDLVPGKDLGDAVGKVASAGLKLALDMFGVGDLGEMMLGLIPDGAFKTAFKWMGDKFGAHKGIAGNFDKGVPAMGGDLIDGVVKYLSGKNKEKSAEAQAKVNAFSAGGGTGNVQQWSAMAAQALARAGISPGQLGAFLALMQAESGGNPMAVNNWDSNAKMGQASRGLMQVIPSTFAAYRDPGLPNLINDPMANMTAAARYIKSVYGGNVPGSPYANGTPGATRGVHLVGEQGPELMNFAGGETVTPAGETASILGGQGTLPEDLMERFKLLMTLAQQMSAVVQASWTKVTTSGKTAQSGLTPVFTDIAKQLGTDVPTAMALMAAANTTTWTAMQAGTTASWTAMRDGTFAEAGDHMSVKMPTWGNEMGTAVGEAWVNMGSATATAWEGMKEGTRGPTNWIIDNSYNNGIRSLWNQVAEVIFEDGAKQLPSVATLAKGGPVHGPGGERADRVPAMLSRGEHVWTAREVHRAGGHHAVQQMRSGVMGGGKVRGAHRGCGFALGGWLGGDVSGSSPSIGTLDLKRGSMMETVGDHLDSIDAAAKSALAGSFYRRMGGSADVLSPTDWMRQYIEKDDELNAIGSGGPPWIPGVSDAITSFGGATVNQRTADMLNMAMGLGASFSVTQGSFSTGVSASAGTHDGGGVVDLAPASNANVAALRAVGFAAWNRGAAWGSPSFSPHIHAVALGDPTVSSGAAAQVMSYLAGGNGLANGGPDNFSGGIPSVDGVAAIGGGRNVDPADLDQNVVSFDRGGFLQPGYTMAFNGTGKPEPVGHHLEPKGSRGVEISMPITINGNANAQEVVDGINAQVLPKLRQYLSKGTGSNG